MTITESNNSIILRYDEDEKIIWAQDATDFYNETSLFTQSKRGLKGAWDDIEKHINDKTTFSDIKSILRERGIKYHQYCAVD